MARVVVNDSTLADIATAIRIRNKTHNRYKPSEMAEAIKKIPSYNTTNQGSLVDSSIVDKSIAGIYRNDTVSAIGDYTFYNCKNLNSIDCAEVITLGKSAFEEADGLVNVSLPKLEEAKAKAFYSASGLKEINIPENVSSI